jgi:hypothetical protein
MLPAQFTASVCTIPVHSSSSLAGAQ